MGSNLRKYKTEKKAKKLDDGQTVGGKGRLTKVVTDKLQNYYGAAIRQNVGNLRIMQDAIWAIFYHTIKASNETLDVQHQYCPKGSKSWCKYQLDVANGTNFYTQDNCLPAIFRKELKPLFTRLSSDELLKRCLKGVTQNQNEAFYSMDKVSKVSFLWQTKTNCMCSTECLKWNQGAAGSATVLHTCGVSKYGINTLRGIRKENCTRIVQSSIKCRNSYNKCCQTLRQERKSKPADKQNYFSGAFSLEPEINKKITEKSQKHLESVEFEIKNDVGITFIHEEVVSMKTF